MEQFKLGNITVDLVQKEIKNINLRVYPLTGRVRISAPNRMDLNTIRLFAISKLSWIKKQQTKIKNQEREVPREFVNKENHYFNGKKYLLEVIEHKAAPKVVLNHSSIELFVRHGANRKKKKAVLEKWYRQKLKEIIPVLIEKWETKINVLVKEFGVKKMKTKWGTCNLKAKRIWLNLELAKRSAECLEYIVVHEMVHLLERNHNNRFISLMNEFMPKWKFYKDELNRLPLRYEY